MKNLKKNFFDIKLVIIICAILSLRMIGLFMVLPVLSIYGIYLKHATKFLVSICIGVYSLFQVMLQVPFGYLSDKVNRKVIIIFGLVLFLIGSLIAANTKSIWGILIGRIIQGSGAVSSSLMALMFDRIKQDKYMLAMLCVGITYGASFFVSIIISPMITNFLGLKGLFWIISILTCISILIVAVFITPCSKKYIKYKKNVSIKNLVVFLKNFYLKKLLIITFLINYVLISNFLIYPECLLSITYSRNMHWKIYCLIISIVFISIVLLMRFIRLYKNSLFFLNICIYILFFSQVILFISTNHLVFLFGMTLFILSFSLISMLLPSAISKQYSVLYRGSLMAFYNTVQFLGMALSSFISGFLYSCCYLKFIFLTNTIIIFLYIFFTIIYSIKHLFFIKKHNHKLH